MISAPTNWDWEEGPGLLGSAWRYKWLLVAAMLVGAALGQGFSELQPIRYEGVATVLLLDDDAGQGQPDPDPERSLQNQVSVMTSASVLNEASRRHQGGLTLEDMRQRVTVEASQESDLITVRALDATPQGAAKLANSVTLAYQDVVAREARRHAADAINDANAEEARLRQRLGQLEATADEGPASAALRAEIGTVTKQLSDVLAEQLRLEAEADRQGAGGFVRREPAELPTRPAQPRPLRNIAAGALLFLLAAAGLAWALAGRRTAAGARVPAITPPERPPAIGGRSAAVSSTGTEKAEAAVHLEPTDSEEATARTLTPELAAAFDRLTSSVEEVMETLRLDGSNETRQNLPQAEAEWAAGQLGLPVVVIMLDNGRGRLEVAGAVGLTPLQRRSTIRYAPDLMREVLDGGPRIVDKADRARFVRAGIPGGLADPLLVVPLVHHKVAFGLLLASPPPDGDGAAAFDDRQVEAITAYVRVIVPTLRALVLLERLDLGFQQERR